MAFPRRCPQAASARKLFQIDATCPLVTKVHMEAQRHHADGLEIVLIGHRHHPEVIGTMGQLPAGAISLIETVADAETLAREESGEARLCDADHAFGRRHARHHRCPAAALSGDPGTVASEDICYATTNRQEAVKSIAGRIELLLVVGAPNSSNSKRLVEVGENNGCARALLVQRAAISIGRSFRTCNTIGITAGASAPEILVNEIIDAFRAHYDVTVENVVLREENVSFKLPRELRAVAAAS